MNSIDVGINSELEEMNGEATSKETFFYILMKKFA
jgi:hypothetical protein